ncbi:MAG: GcrA family cell cycle regulator [Alphaproteobacteria bacterium]
MAWTDEMINTLKILWDQGISTGEIGKRLGVTKNSVVGKVHRLGLDGRPSPIKRKGEEPKPAKPKAEKKAEPKEIAKKEVKVKEASKNVEVKEEIKIVKKTEKATPVKVEKTIEEPKFTPIKKEKVEEPFKEGACSLTELGPNSCRWPIGDPKDENFHFCGKKTRVGQTYCDEHCLSAYVKIVKK